MRPHIFHLAIPTHDLAAAKRFYVDQLGCRLAREYADRVTLEFFGDQVVCHLAPDKIDQQPEMYPRHFGVTFADQDAFDKLHALALEAQVEFFRDRFVRWAGKPAEHHAFFLKDPSNNLLEFKYYPDPEMMY